MQTFKCGLVLFSPVRKYQKINFKWNFKKLKCSHARMHMFMFMGARLYAGTHTCVCMRGGQRSMLDIIPSSFPPGIWAPWFGYVSWPASFSGVADVAKRHIHLDGKMGSSCLPPTTWLPCPVFYMSGKDVNLGSHPCAEANSAISSNWHPPDSLLLMKKSWYWKFYGPGISKVFLLKF